VKRLTLLLALFAIISTAACANSSSSSAGSEQQLIALHEQTLMAHRERDVDAFLASWSGEVVDVSRGSLSSIAIDDARTRFGRYLESTEFEYYRNRKSPVVHVSKDGSMGWVAAEVEAKGIRTSSDGEAAPFEFVSAWISLFEYEDGQWRLVANSSSFQN